MESLDDEKKYYCENCKSKQKSEKTTSIFEPPNILIIHLKRFRFGTQRNKIDKNISFTALIDISMHCDWENKANWESGPYAVEYDILPFTYSLYATSNHHGNSRTGGHCTSYVKSPQNVWHHKNDSKVSITSESHVLSQKTAYILFYKLNRLRKNSKTYNYNKAVMKQQGGEHTKFCMACGDELSDDNTVTCMKDDCTCKYHSYCIGDMNVQDGFQCNICEYFSEYE